MDWGSATGGLLGGVANAIGSGIAAKKNLQAVRETNEMNYRIAQQSNEWSEKMFNKQIAYNMDMWNKENAYNTASAQRERLEQAGLNPYLMMNGGSAGTASNAGGVTPPAVTTPTMQAPKYDYSSVGQAIGGVANMLYGLDSMLAGVDKTKKESALLTSQATNMDLQNKFYAAKTTAEIERLIADTSNTREKQKYQALQNQVFMEGFNTDIALKKSMIDYNYAQRENALAQAAMKREELNWLPAEKRAEIAQRYSEIELNRKRGILTDKQADHEVFKMLKTAADAVGVHLNNNVLRESQDALIAINKLNAIHAYNNRGVEGALGLWNALGNESGEYTIGGSLKGLGMDLKGFAKAWWEDATSTWLKFPDADFSKIFDLRYLGGPHSSTGHYRGK